MDKDLCKIMELCQEYDFYCNPVGLCCLMIKMNMDKDRKYLLRNWGFVIYRKSNINVFIEFIFIKPEYRRKGIFTKLINTLKNTTKIITFTSSKDAMKQFAKKENFKEIAPTRNGKEIYYGWSKVYSTKYIYDNFY